MPPRPDAGPITRNTPVMETAMAAPRRQWIDCLNQAASATNAMMGMAAMSMAASLAVVSRIPRFSSVK